MFVFDICPVITAFCPYSQLDKHGTEEQKNRLLPRLCLGEMTGALAMSETGSGSDVLSMKTVASQANEGADYILNGSKVSSPLKSKS